MFETIINFFKKIGNMPKQKEQGKSKDAAKERLHLVLMQDRANVSADFLDLMRQEIIEVIKKYINIDEGQIDVRLTNKSNSDGTTGAPALYANIPIVSIKDDVKGEIEKEQKEKNTQPIEQHNIENTTKVEEKENIENNKDEQNNIQNQTTCKEEENISIKHEEDVTIEENKQVVEEISQQIDIKNNINTNQANTETYNNINNQEEQKNKYNN